MLTWFLIGLLLLAVTILLLKAFAAADPKVLARAIVWTASGLLGAVFLYLAFTGRLSWLFVAIPAVMPWVLRARMLARMFKTFSRMRGASTGRPGGQASRVETRFLRMTLDHDSGRMDGEVIEGNWAGRKLSDMDRIALIALLVHLNDVDGQSASLLVAYLDRERPGWQEGEQGHAAGAKTAEEPGTGGFPPGAMARDEALRILGLEEGADEAAIKAAHRRLMALMHPDRGGSSYLAAKINQARDALL
ncbi:MAG: hypothetical protein IT564_07105 [Rhodospirillales bacterium]|nr:hypothetical protein [Rhodospirillales bacterium]